MPWLSTPRMAPFFSFSPLSGITSPGRASTTFSPARALGAPHTTCNVSVPVATLHTLRQQLTKREGRFNVALSDFIAPASTGVPDYVGAFAVTAGIGEDEIADRFKLKNDDYSSILVKALADRLAEAFAERMHQLVRKELWGYAADETFTCDQLVLEHLLGK